MAEIKKQLTEEQFLEKYKKEELPRELLKDESNPTVKAMLTKVMIPVEPVHSELEAIKRLNAKPSQIGLFGSRTSATKETPAAKQDLKATKEMPTVKQDVKKQGPGQR